MSKHEPRGVVPLVTPHYLLRWLSDMSSDRRLDGAFGSAALLARAMALGVTPDAPRAHVKILTQSGWLSADGVPLTRAMRDAA